MDTISRMTVVAAVLDPSVRIMYTLPQRVMIGGDTMKVNEVSLNTHILTWEFVAMMLYIEHPEKSSFPTQIALGMTVHEIFRALERYFPSKHSYTFSPLRIPEQAFLG